MWLPLWLDWGKKRSHTQKITKNSEVHRSSRKQKKKKKFASNVKETFDSNKKDISSLPPKTWLCSVYLELVASVSVPSPDLQNESTHRATLKISGDWWFCNLLKAIFFYSSQMLTQSLSKWPAGLVKPLTIGKSRPFFFFLFIIIIFFLLFFFFYVCVFFPSLAMIPNSLTAGDLFVCWLFNVSATCECISGTDLLRQFYVLPHWDRSCRSNFLPHPVTVYWHRANQSQRRPYNASRLAG